MSESEVRQLITGYDGVVLDDRSTPELAIYSIKGQVMAVVHPRFINILLVGQLSDEEVRSQIRHAYEETNRLLTAGS